MNTAHSLQTINTESDFAHPGEIVANHEFSSLKVMYHGFDGLNFDDVESLEDIDVATIKLEKEFGDFSLTLNLLDWLHVVSAYGINYKFLSFSDKFSSLKGTKLEQVATDLVSCLDKRDIDYIFKGKVLTLLLDALGLEQSSFSTLTKIQFSQVQKAQSEKTDITPYTYRTIISLYRFLMNFTYASKPVIFDETYKLWGKFGKFKQKNNDVHDHIDFNSFWFKEGGPLSHVSQTKNGYKFSYGEVFHFDKSFFKEDAPKDKTQLLNEYLNVRQLKAVQKYFNNELHTDPAFDFESANTVVIDLNSMSLEGKVTVNLNTLLTTELDEYANQLSDIYNIGRDKPVGIKTKLLKAMKKVVKHLSNDVPEFLTPINLSTGEFAYDGNVSIFEIPRSQIDVNMIRLEVAKLVAKIDCNDKQQVIKDVYQLVLCLREVEVPVQPYDFENEKEFSVNGKIVTLSENDLNLYFVGYRKKLLAEHGLEQADASEFFDKLSAIAHEYFKAKALSKKTFGVKSFNDDAPHQIVKKVHKQGLFKAKPLLKSQASIDIALNQRKTVTLNALDLMEIHAGIRFPVVLGNQDYSLTEDNFFNMDIIAQQFFLHRKLYGSTWFELMDRLGVKRSMLKNLKVRDLESYYDTENAERVVAPWMFLSTVNAISLAVNPYY